MPGQPLVFGRAQGKFFFGLPGNPASTMVTFEIFARAAVELLGGQSEPMLPLPWSKLTRDFRQKTGLTRFLPATLSADGSEVTPIRWQGRAMFRRWRAPTRSWSPSPTAKAGRPATGSEFLLK